MNIFLLLSSIHFLSACLQSLGSMCHSTPVQFPHTKVEHNSCPFYLKSLPCANDSKLTNKTCISPEPKVKPFGSDTRCFEGLLIIGTGCWDQDFSLVLSGLVGLSAGPQCIGDFTKYGQPVPRPDPTRGVGIAHFQLWGEGNSRALTLPFFSAFYRCVFPVRWSNQLNEPRDVYMRHWIEPLLTHVMAWCLCGAKPLPAPIVIYNHWHP